MPDLRSPANLLLAQALVLGVTLAFLVIPGNAVFLESQGADRLPYAYLGIALTGTAVSVGLNRLQARVGLFALGVATSTLVSAFVTLAWLALVVAGWTAASLGVLILAAVHGQLGFAFIGAQAGRMFDVQAIKRAFPRIVSGFVFGFMLGGAAVDLLVRWVGDPSHLLTLAALGGLVFAGLMSRAARLVAPDEAPPESPAAPTAAALPFSQLLRTPLVGAVFVYQVLSTMGTQLVEYLLYERAAARFVGTAELASFIGRFTFGLNLIDLVVLALIGGWVMARYGLRLGVGANPVVVTALVLAALLTATAQGIDSFALFVLIAVARILDLTIADGATRTSINATFQALPEQQRLPAQLGVEGAGVPVALGITAALVLAINSRPGVNTVGVLVATGIVCGLWCLSAVVVFLRYRRAVVASARRGLLSGPGIDPAEPATLAALLRLAGSQEPEDVARALMLLESVEDERLTEVLATNASHPDGRVRAASLPMLARRAPRRALGPALICVEATDESERVAAAHSLAEIDDAEAGRALLRIAETDRGGLGAVALGGLLAGSATTASAQGVVAMLASSGATQDRACAASALRVASAPPMLEILARLLRDDEATVRTAAEGSVAALGADAQVVLFDQLRSTADGAALDRFLRNCDLGPGSPLGGPLVHWLADGGSAHPIAHRRLARSGWMADEAAEPTLSTLVGAGIEHIATAHRWLGACGADDSRPALQRLRRALQEELGAGRTRMLATLGPLAGAGAVRSASSILEGTREGDAGLALEALELTLGRDHRRGVLEALRLAADAEAGALTDISLERVLDLTADVGWAAHPDWLQACALAVLQAEDVAVPDAVRAAGPVSAELCG